MVLQFRAAINKILVFTSRICDTISIRIYGVASDMAHNPFSGNKTAIVKGILVVGAIIVALGLGMLLRQIQGSDKAAAPSSGSGDSSADGVTSTKLSTESKTASELANGGSVDESNKYIAEQLAKPTATDPQKFDLYRQQALNAYNSGNYQLAFDSWVSANAIKTSASLLEVIGDAAREQGKKTIAADYYKKALEQLAKEKASNPSYNDEKAMLETKVKSQGGTI